MGRLYLINGSHEIVAYVEPSDFEFGKFQIERKPVRGTGWMALPKSYSFEQLDKIQTLLYDRMDVPTWDGFWKRLGGLLKDC